GFGSQGGCLSRGLENGQTPVHICLEAARARTRRFGSVDPRHGTSTRWDPGTAELLDGVLDTLNRPLKKWASNASGTMFSKKRVAQTRLRSDCTGQSGLFAGHLAHFGRTYPRAHA